MSATGTVAAVAEQEPEDAQRLATEARDRVRFEEDALALSDQVYRVARHLANSREDAEELVQETYARAFRSWRSFTPGTNLRAWLFTLMHNLNVNVVRRNVREGTPGQVDDNWPSPIAATDPTGGSRSVISIAPSREFPRNSAR